MGGALVAPVFRFIVPGQPVPKARPRAGKGGRIYTPAETVKAESTIRLLAKRAGCPCLGGLVKLSVSFYRADARRCDVDNLTKLVQDALNGLAYVDDSQIVWLTAVKAIDRENPRTEVEIEEVEPVERSAA
jgi:crossover junction endodeoxyribonuclease RusA